MLFRNLGLDRLSACARISTPMSFFPPLRRHHGGLAGMFVTRKRPDQPNAAANCDRRTRTNGQYTATLRCFSSMNTVTELRIVCCSKEIPIFIA